MVRSYHHECLESRNVEESWLRSQASVPKTRARLVHEGRRTRLAGSGNSSLSFPFHHSHPPT